jgi:hypothetical protein
MDAKTSLGGRDRSKECTGERGGHFTRGSLEDLYLGGLFPFHQDVGLGRPMPSPRTPMTSSTAFGSFGRKMCAKWNMWQVPEAQEGLTFFPRTPMLH